MTIKLLPCLLGIVYLSAAIADVGQRNGGVRRVAHKLAGGHLSHGNDDNAELMTSSAGEGRDAKAKKQEDEKKTLSQQVADGKYGLIQKELFSKPVKRPGVISYKENGEVPRDNANNLGGLNKNDIWLSENHLLVIKGGTYPPHTDRKNIHASEDTPVWVPIDDYRAPLRQVKIPKNPKVPPPFPVQLTDGGPLLLLGTNATTTLNGTFGSELYPVYPPEGFVLDGEAPSNELSDPHKTNATAGQAAFAVPPLSKPGLDPVGPNQGVPVNDSLSQLFPFLAPGAVLPPPPDNMSDFYDEDDPSIYYPPPYSFYYERDDNATQVEAGPLVPGIVLPPPPNFFAPLEQPKHPTTPAYIHTTTSAPSIATKEKTYITTTLRTINDIYSTTKSPIDYPIKNNTIPTRPSITRRPQFTIRPTIKKKQQTIAIIKPQVVNQIPFKTYGPPPTRPRTSFSTTQVPLKAYYTTSYNVDPILIPQKSNRTYISSNLLPIPRPTTEPPAQYYYYEENVISTTPKYQPINQHGQYYLPKYYVPPDNQVNRFRPTQPPSQNVRYYYLNDDLYRTRPTKKPDSFSIHIARLKAQIHSQQSLPKDNYLTTGQLTSKPLYQYSFQAANYQQDHPRPEYHSEVPRPPTRYRVEIQEAVEVTPPTPTYEDSQQGNYYYQSAVTENPLKYQNNRNNNRPYAATSKPPKPVSQYSFEATPNPIFQQFYTKQDEKYIDDVTKQYFTVFGKKLPIATTPIPNVDIRNRFPPYYQREKSNPPPTLQRDTIINYLRSRPAPNPQAEYVPTRQDQRKYLSQNDQYQQIYERQPIESEQPISTNERKPYVTYKLPGDEGTHFYFLTPQLAQKQEQDSSYYFSRSRQHDRNRYL